MKVLAIRAHDKGLELSFRVAPSVPRVLTGDPSRLRQVINNLVGNAVKFTENGEVGLEVESQSSAEGRVTLRFAARDTGIGIAPEKQQSIFEPFVQADGSITRKYGGTGLGLTISSRLVELMGGRLTVESRLGQGSTFHFSASFGLKPEAQKEAQQADGRLRHLRGRRVLLLDDNHTNRRILEDLLTQWRMVTTSLDGVEAALAELEGTEKARAPFALVIVDVNVPGLQGFEFVRRLKERPTPLRSKVVILKSAFRKDDAVLCRELGVAAYLMKPCKHSELLEAVLTALELAQEAPAEHAGDESAQAGAVAPESQKGKANEGRPAKAQAEDDGKGGANGSESTASGAGMGLRLLLAEDNPVNQKVALRLLEKHGHRVVVAANGKEALAALEKESFDLILMDVQMPEMGGFEATRAIREKEKATGGHIPIVAMTAHAMKGDRERCLESGMDSYVTKPVQEAILLSAVESCLKPPAGGPAPGGEAASSAVFDRAQALSMIGHDRDLLLEIAGLFLKNYPKLLKEMRRALADRDSQTLLKAAHSLKGSVGSFAARATYHAAQTLEELGARGQLDLAAEAFAALEREIQRLVPQLEGLVGSAGAHAAL
jgi:CheY-like chemotaxis protein